MKQRLLERSIIGWLCEASVVNVIKTSNHFLMTYTVVGARISYRVDNAFAFKILCNGSRKFLFQSI